jgi:hypothetical protein
MWFLGVLRAQLADTPEHETALSTAAVAAGATGIALLLASSAATNALAFKVASVGGRRDS